MRRFLLCVLCLPGFLLAQENVNYDPDHDLNGCYTMMDILSFLVLMLPDVPASDSPNPNYDPDFDGDGNITITDLTGLLTWFGTCEALDLCVSPTFDGHSYSVIQMGLDCWFTENLRTTEYADGTPIPHVADAQTWTEQLNGARTLYDDDEANVALYGRLYNWFAVEDARGLCPAGWHVSTDDDWVTLELTVGMHPDDAYEVGSFRGVAAEVGVALKATSGWPAGGNGTDEIGFAGAPGGVRNGEPFDFGGGNYAGEGELGFWWSSTATAPLGSALNRVLSATNPGVNRSAIQNQFGMSVRCVLDHE